MQGCLRSAWQMHFSGVSSNSRMPANWKYCLGSQQCLDTLRKRPYRSCCFDLTSSLLGSPETLSLSDKQHPLGTTLSLAKESSCCRASVSLLACDAFEKLSERTRIPDPLSSMWKHVEACGSMRKHVVKKKTYQESSRHPLQVQHRHGSIQASAKRSKPARLQVPYIYISLSYIHISYIHILPYIYI